MKSVRLALPSWRLVRGQLERGRDLIVGIDEVGRGALAGPVVAAAVILPPRRQIRGLKDSKMLSAPARTQLDRTIRRQALAVGLGWVAAADVDAHGLTWAVRTSGERALTALGHQYHAIILDGKHNYLAPDYPSEVIVAADALITPVAAASVVAKVARDRYMEQLSRHMPAYGFEQHKGYGTVAHRRTLELVGPCEIHRFSYAPLARLG